MQEIRLILVLKGSLCKSGPVDLDWKIDFAYFLCVARHSCPYTKLKPQSVWSDLLNFSYIRECLVHPSGDSWWSQLWTPRFNTSLKFNYTKTKNLCTRTNKHHGYLNYVFKCATPVFISKHALSLNQAFSEALTTPISHSSSRDTQKWPDQYSMETVILNSVE